MLPSLRVRQDSRLPGLCIIDVHRLAFSAHKDFNLFFMRIEKKLKKKVVEKT